MVYLSPPPVMNISEDNQLSGSVIGAAIDVHRQLGPNLDEIGDEEQKNGWRFSEIIGGIVTGVPFTMRCH